MKIIKKIEILKSMKSVMGENQYCDIIAKANGFINMNHVNKTVDVGSYLFNNWNKSDKEMFKYCIDCDEVMCESETEDQLCVVFERIKDWLTTERGKKVLTGDIKLENLESK